MATPIKFPDYYKFLTTLYPAWLQPLHKRNLDYSPYDSKHEFTKLSDDHNINPQTVFRDSAIEIMSKFLRDLVGIEYWYNANRESRVHLHPRISWEHSWSELSGWLQLDGSCPAGIDGNARLQSLGYKARAWKQAVTDHLSHVVYINDRVIGNPTFHAQVDTEFMKRVNAIINGGQ